MQKTAINIKSIAKAIAGFSPARAADSTVGNVALPMLGGAFGNQIVTPIIQDEAQSPFDIQSEANKRINRYANTAVFAAMASPKFQKSIWQRSLKPKEVNKLFQFTGDRSEGYLKNYIKTLPEDVAKRLNEKIKAMPGGYEDLNDIFNKLPQGDVADLKKFYDSYKVKTPLKGLSINMGLPFFPAGLASRVDPLYRLSDHWKHTLENKPILMEAFSKDLKTNTTDVLEAGKEWLVPRLKNKIREVAESEEGQKQLSSLNKALNFETGSLTGGVLGSVLGGVGGKSLADLIIPKSTSADFKNLDERGFRKRVRREKNKDRLRTLLSTIGGFGGAGVGTALGIKYLPQLINKLGPAYIDHTGINKALGITPATDATNEKVSSSIAKLAKQAADNGVYQDLIGKPALGAGLGLVADILANNLSPMLGIEESNLNEKQKKDRRNRAMFYGGLVGLGKGVINQGYKRDLLPTNL